MSIETRLWGRSSKLVLALAESRSQTVSESKKRRPESALSARIKMHKAGEGLKAVKTPLTRMHECRDALAFLDTTGWNRSFHQRLFHEDFLKACTRTFWKMEPPGSFARAHQQMLQENS